MSIEDIFQRYLHAGAISRDPDAIAALFTDDGIYEAPLIPHRLAGREAIRSGISAYHRGSPDPVDFENSRLVLHRSADPDTFIAEIDTVLVPPSGPRTMSLVWIFRVRDGQIAHLRDYFDPAVLRAE
ncbi:nuclear transport factor 2 family protein [Actinoplanes sp. NBRC 103695]|uniref:nuclear transport factor 2 family protein n=1 Tax=Actinoplanes sp. NBRC 103695 TaxID=3032202 RepID=UPI00249FEE49|nr:nuclear transport factor 2 family protein [Actinoplanes sp. NBRC 103695]GLY98040.1 hypothetical protein Acsp02_52940 [Actinoplanes sp. NBRC 103695]